MPGLFFDDYETPVYRPPSEAESFILRVTRGCAHNHCTYCNMYRGSELKDQFERGEFTPLTPAGLMEELKVIIEHLDLPETEHMIFRSNHVSNYIRLAATLPRDKDQLLADIDESIAYLKKQKHWDIYNHDWSKF